MSAPDLLIFTDLDGTLLNHDDYGFEAAKPMLRCLEDAGIPVIPATSKTRSEMLAWRKRAGNGHPLVVENGAAVLLPKGYFSELVDGLTESGGFLVRAFVAGRDHWQRLLAEAAVTFPGCWRSFSDLGPEGVAALTGLDPETAALASAREYGEPLHWLGSGDSLDQFRRWMHDHGANVLQGGRFVHVSGQCDKGAALKWLTGLYRRQPGAGRIATIALGDSGNDIAMLRACDHPVWVRSPVHPPPSLALPGDDPAVPCPVTTKTAPGGWVEGVGAVLSGIRPDLDLA